VMVTSKGRTMVRAPKIRIPYIDEKRKRTTVERSVIGEKKLIALNRKRNLFPQLINQAALSIIPRLSLKSIFLMKDRKVAFIKLFPR
jgi:hypothetical protein